MRSIRDIYKAGRGPSSSHTMGPARAAAIFREETPEADAYRAVLYGSLPRLGEGAVQRSEERRGGTGG